MCKNEMNDSWVAGRRTYNKAVLLGKLLLLSVSAFQGLGKLLLLSPLSQSTPLKKYLRSSLKVPSSLLGIGPTTVH